MRTTTNPLKLAAGTLILLLSGCHDAGNNGPTDAGNAATLCVNSDCGSKLELVTIPDAENIFFLDDGRLIVSGGRNVYEITGSLDAGFVATPLSAEDCGFTGLAVAHDHLYAVCGTASSTRRPWGRNWRCKPSTSSRIPASPTARSRARTATCMWSTNP